MTAAQGSTHVALLRGINVGRAKRVAMADLRALVEGLGYGGVRSLLNSGNLVFSARAADRRDHGARIEKAMAKELGLAARVLVLTAAELTAIVDGNPLAEPGRHPSCLHVTVARGPADLARLRALAKQDWAPDVLAVGRRAAYLWCPRGMMASALAETIARGLGDGITTRNWATLSKLHALVAGRPAAARP
jgi:uncharacterized protein (DUF1697 family)